MSLRVFIQLRNMTNMTNKDLRFYIFLFRREREGLLHRYEIVDEMKNMRKSKADPAKTIKCFSRSAAGQNMTDPDSLRPPPVLLYTIRYLFTK